MSIGRLRIGIGAITLLAAVLAIAAMLFAHALPAPHTAESERPVGVSAALELDGHSCDSSPDAHAVQHDPCTATVPDLAATTVALDAGRSTTPELPVTLPAARTVPAPDLRQLSISRT